MSTFFGTQLDLTNVSPQGTYEPVPAGTYRVVCTEFEVVDKDWGKAGKVKFQIIDGPHSNRQINDLFIITHHNSAQAQDIGQRRIRAWCDALGISPVLESADPLLNKPVIAKVKIDPPRTVGDKTYNAQNRIETFFADSDVQQAAPMAAPVQRPAAVAAPKPAVAAAPAAAASAKPMPWKRNAQAQA